MSTLDDLDNALSGGKSLNFKDGSQIGDKVELPIISGEAQQARDFDTKAPATWPDGRPKMQLTLRLKNGDEVGMFYINTWGKQGERLKEAIAAAGKTKLSEVIVPGATFRSEHLGMKQAKGASGASYTYRDQTYGFYLGAQLDTALDSATAAFGSDATPVASAPAAGGADLNAVPEGVPADRWVAMDEGQKLGYLKAVGKA